MNTLQSKYVLLVLAAVSVIASFIPALAQANSPSFRKVMILMFENEDAKRALDQPNFRQFAANGAYLSNLNAEVHPSQPNYIALVSGDLQGVRGDGNVNIDARHIGDLLEEAGHSWKTYLEGYPGGCFKGARSGDYARKHNPFVSFLNVQNNPARCAQHLVPASDLRADVAAGTVPDFSLYIPDLKNDGHDTGVAYADRWFGKTIVPLFSDSRFMRDMIVIATFDESAPLGGNMIYGAVYGDSVVRGSSTNTRLNHYSILRTIEETFGLSSLGVQDRSANSIDRIWK